LTILYDKLIKKPLFGCQLCGQCLLSQTSYISPMLCPKGMRNGPCGGTLDGKCEVLEDQPCVWLRIHEHNYEDAGVHKPLDASLVGTSSLTNYLSGRDKATRFPQPFQGHARADSHLPSVFSQKFDQIKPIITYEIPSPREHSGLKKVEAITRQIQPWVDGINTTTNAGGVPSLHSLETARVVVSSGVSPIVQFCGRDQDVETFREEVRAALSDGFANILALTGDWNPGTERERNPERWFPMDSLQMVDILAGKSGFVKQPFIGVASTAYMQPMETSIARFMSKLKAGADFTQTQIVTETRIFSDWLSRVRSTDEGRRCRILVSVPMIGKQRPYEILRSLPGVVVDEAFARSLATSDDLVAGGLATARELIRELLLLDIDGVHLMNFGVPVEAAIDLIQEIRNFPVHADA
jgi:methylenetetrahydrofolate reductase (NADPH)